MNTTTPHALTIHQPWAGAIAHGTKRVENRTWPAPERHIGTRILIHAGAEIDKHAIVYGPHLDVLSAIIAIARLTECHAAHMDGTCCGPWGDPKGFHWLLDDVTPLHDPVPCKGRQRLWIPDEETVAAVLAQLAPART